MARQLLILFLILFAIMATTCVVSAQQYTIQDYWPDSAPVYVYPPYYVRPQTYIYVDPTPVYVEPIRYWHPDHWEYWYDTNGQRWRQWMPGHYGFRPYRGY